MHSPNGIRAIFFDLDGTLRHNRPDANVFFTDQALRLGAPAAPNIHKKTMRWAHAYWANSDDLRADIEAYGREETFWKNYTGRHLSSMGCSPELAEALTPQMQRYMDEDYQPEDCVPPDAPLTLQRLREAGFRLAVVSNRTNPFDEYLVELGLRDLVDFILSAGEVNSWKPDPGVFERALELAGTQPEETLYVGDNYYADVIGAQRAGIRPVLIDPRGIFPEAECPVIHTLSEMVDLVMDGQG